jgi:hypothetical protein
VDVTALLTGGSPMRNIISSAANVDGTNTMANRVVLGRDAKSGSLAGALAIAPDSVAASHLIDQEDQRLLGAGEFARFLDRRADRLRAHIRRHVAAMAEWGARGGRAISDVIRSAA